MPAKHLVPASLAAVMLFSLLTFASSGATSPVSLSQGSLLNFTPNAGQWDDQVHFRASTDGATMWFAADGAYYQFVREVSPASPPDPRLQNRTRDSQSLFIKASFVGANQDVEIVGEGLLGSKCNFFLGNNPARWQADLPNYEAIVYRDVYPGIDLKYYGNDRQLEYDFIVSPGADPSRIQIRYDGAERVSVNGDGQLEVTTAWGTVTEMRPYIYQRDGGGYIVLAGRYRLLSDNSFGFELNDNYDPNLPLIIDPVLTYSSYLGGAYAQYANGVTFDSEGNIVIVGDTRSADFPLVNPLQGVLAGRYDLFVTKINPGTGDILFSTFFGGTETEQFPAVTLDATGNVVVSSYTDSEDIPTVNPFQSDLLGDWDAIIFKLSADGSTLLFSTYLGGTKVEYAGGIAVDASNNVYVCGITTSFNFPLQNPYCDEISGGDYDGFVTKFSPSGDALIYSTYLGGRDMEQLRSIAVNASGEAYVVGSTYSDDYPAVNALYQTQINQDGPTDAVITKFTAGGDNLVFSTFIPGTEDEWFIDVALDESGTAYVVGSSESDDFPVVNPIQAERSGAGSDDIADVVVAALTGNGDALLFSTYLGGLGEDYGESIALAPDGGVFFTGTTFSYDFPTYNGLDFVMDGASDALVVRLNTTGTGIVYSTFLGGSSGEQGEAVAVDPNSNPCIVGSTYSADFPLANATQAIPGSTLYSNVFVSMLGGCCVGARGNFDGDPDDLLSILDIVYAMDWFFSGGDEPPCLDEADVDASGQVNIEDVVYLISYLFRNGPPPAGC
ncbi:MAG: SBBP repeat-containing protein [Candidatus Zixiibacteriota bacterium]|nr:MAG: SBBP repeat-containing protein [candidate division Zixibacteria bacterium]